MWRHKAQGERGERGREDRRVIEEERERRMKRNPDGDMERR